MCKQNRKLLCFRSAKDRFYKAFFHLRISRFVVLREQIQAVKVNLFIQRNLPVRQKCNAHFRQCLAVYTVFITIRLLLISEADLMVAVGADDRKFFR